jgi:hypothetical protein
MELILKINNKQRIAYIPKGLFEILGTKVRATPNRTAVLLCPEKTNIDDTIKSLDINRADLIHAKEMQELKNQE